MHHPSGKSKIYLMYDALYLIKNVRNQPLVLQTIYFSAFHFNEIRDEINATAGELRWKSLFDIYDNDQLLDANLKLALKLSYRALHPGDNRCLLYGNTFQRMMTQHFCSSLIFGGRL